MNAEHAETRWRSSAPRHTVASSNHYTFQTFETRADIPSDEVKAMVLEQSNVMHDRLVKIGQLDNDPASHVAAFWQKIDSVVPPNGRFYFLRDAQGTAIGFGAIRKLDESSAEMKHLYVRDTHRGQGLGRKLVQRRLDDARSMGLKTVFADTIGAFPEMPTLYESLGFRRIEAPKTSGTLKASPKIADCLVFFRKDL